MAETQTATATRRAVAPDSTAILRTLRAIIEPGQVTELRALHAVSPAWPKPHTVSGYFDYDHLDAMAKAAATIQAPAVYFIPNPVDPALLARAANRLEHGAKNTTADSDILQRRWLLIDTDPWRPAGISSTDAQHAAALAKAAAIAEWLSLAGWPEPMQADSGNGAHILYRVDLPTDDGGLLQRILAALAFRFDDATVNVDLTTFNPARIWKLYGTVARKGDDTAERPHRLATLLHVPDTLIPVPRPLLDAVAAMLPKEPERKTAPGPAFDLDGWIRDHLPDAEAPQPWQQGGRRWILPVCPWNAEHTGGAAYIVQLPSGAIDAGCHHNGCAGRDWRALRDLLEPRSTPRPAIGGNGHRPGAEIGATVTSGETAAELPEIIATGRAMRAVTKDALDTLTDANASPAVFVRSGELTRIGQNEHGLPVIERMTEAAVRGRMERCAQFTRLHKSKEGDDWQHIPIAPPLDVVRDLMALGAWPFPPLVGIIEAPTIRPDGHLLTAPGYDAATRLYHAPAGGLTVPPISEQPTDSDKAAALELLREAIQDFPFEDDASRANALAAMITPVVRSMIAGPVPMALFDKPQAGTGASLLAEVVALIATGRPSAMFTAPADDEGWKKEITSLLLQGRTVITVDNIEGRLFSPSLAAVLTAQLWEDRLLGQNKSATLLHRAVWIGTGNNIRLGGDLPRRCYWVRMDAQEARPWERSGFRHPDLFDWVEKQRGAILAAILTLARAWVTAGRTKAAALPKLGGFESWAETIGGILINAGVSGFLGNLAAMYEQADDDTPQWELFLTVWHDKWGAELVTTQEVAKALKEPPAGEMMTPENKTLKEALPVDLADTEDRGFTRKLGWALTKRKGMRFPNGLSIKRGNKTQGANRWYIVEAPTKM